MQLYSCIVSHAHAFVPSCVHTQPARWLQKREAGGTVHLNPLKNHISGRDYAMQVMQPAPKDDDDEDEDDDE